MKKAVNVTIGSRVFFIEEDAYQVLAAYLNDIKKHFHNTDDVEEIIGDIEISIAEKFSSHITATNQAVTLRDVERVITAMGSVNDIAGEAQADNMPQTQPNSEQKEQKNCRRLYRDTDNRMLGGVSAGLGAYFNVDPVIFRILFVIFTFVGGSGVIAYIVLWIIVPPANTTARRLEMRGESVTLSKITDYIEKGIERVKK